MNKTLLVIKHEVRQALRRKSYIIMTIIFPILALVGIAGYGLIQSLAQGLVTSAEVIKVGYVDKVGIFNIPIEQPNFSLTSYTSEEQAKTALSQEDIEKYFVIPADYFDNGVITVYGTKKEINLDISSQTRNQINNFLLGNMNNIFADRLDEKTLLRLENPIQTINNIRLDESGQPAAEQGGVGTFVISFIFVILLMFAIFTSSGYLLQSMIEEKENRVIEILLSSVSSLQLLVGKVIGLGIAGLLQVIFWLITGLGLIQLASTQISGITGIITFTPHLVILGITYFILGYLLYAILMTGVGAIGSTARESQQLSGIFTLGAVIPLWLTNIVMLKPDHIIARILTIFPLSAPTMIMLRLGLTEIPAWELATSVTLMVISIILAFLLAAKMLRAFLLMYGRRPTFKEIIRSLRQA